MRKSIIIITGLIFLGFLGTCVYFVGGVSATFPPIRKYVFQGNVEQFGKALEEYKKLDSNFKYKISRRDSSNKEDDGGRDINIEMKRHGANIIYGLVCENIKSDNEINAEIDLVEARDDTNKIGGYGIKATGMKSLLDYFENDLFVRLLKNEHAVIAVKKEGFFERIHIY